MRFTPVVSTTSLYLLIFPAFPWSLAPTILHPHDAPALRLDGVPVPIRHPAKQGRSRAAYLGRTFVNTLRPAGRAVPLERYSNSAHTIV